MNTVKVLVFLLPAFRLYGCRDTRVLKEPL